MLTNNFTAETFNHQDFPQKFSKKGNIRIVILSIVILNMLTFHKAL
jgi:hypothetical protein